MSDSTITIITSRGSMAESTRKAVMANLMAIYAETGSEAMGYADSFHCGPLSPVGGFILTGADITPEMHETLRRAALVGQPDFN